MKQFGTTRKSICKGIAGINEIFGEAQKIVEKSNSLYYDTPRYIFRGI